MGFFDFFKRRKAFKEKHKKDKDKHEERKVVPGLCLSGGGTRGFAHIGAIKALEENGISFDIVTGTSVGSLVGGLYSAGYKADELIEIGKSLKEKDFRSSKFILVPSKSSTIETTVTRFIGDSVFSDLKKQFKCVAVDVREGKEVVLQNGSVAKAISASCAVPGIFTPVIWDNYVLQDGGITNPLPADIAKQMGADVVISIDINSTRGHGIENDSTKTVDILLASLRIAMATAMIKGELSSDILIQPNLRKYKSSSLDGMEEMIQLGYDAAMDKMDEIKAIINQSKKDFLSMLAENGKSKK